MTPELTNFGYAIVAREGGTVGQAEQYAVAEARSCPELKELVSCADDHGSVAWDAGAAGDKQDRNQYGSESAAHDDLDTFLAFRFAARSKHVSDNSPPDKDDGILIELNQLR